MAYIGHSTIDEGEEFIDKLGELCDFLPREYKDENEKKYIDALILATRTSYENGLYQFAYIQYHMLFMTAVYYAILKVSFFQHEELENALFYMLKDRYNEFRSESNTKNRKLYFGSFAIINESDVFMLLRLVGLNDSLLGELKKLVRHRNNYAHANGQLQLTSDELFMKEIKNYNSKIHEVVGLLKSNIEEFYKKTISDPNFYDKDLRAYLDTDEQIIEEFIREYSLSKEELNWLRKIPLLEFDSCKGKTAIKKLHRSLINYYKNLS